MHARFQLFIVNTGWQSEATRVLEENLPNLKALLPEVPVFVLTAEQSRRVIAEDPARIGSDPCILMVDTQKDAATGYHGFRLSLGTLRKRDEALAVLQTFTRFIVSHLDSQNIERDVRDQLHKEGLTNLIEVLRTVI